MIAYVRRADLATDAFGSFPTLLVPASWECIPQERLGNVTLSFVYPFTRFGESVIGGSLRQHNDVFFLAWMMVPHATMLRALFVLTGHPFVLQRLADMIASDGLSWTRSWPDLPSFRADDTTLAQQVRVQWPTEHTVGGTARLIARGQGLEDDDGEGA